MNERKGQRRERQGTASEVGREEPEGKDGIKVRGESKRAQRGKFQAGPKVRGEPESVSGWGRSWRGSAPARFPARDRSSGGRSQGRAPEAAPGAERWSGWAEVDAEGRTPKPSSPRGWSGRAAGRVAGRALAHRSGRPALSSVRGLRAGAGGGQEGGEQRPCQGGVHPAGPAGRGGPSWEAPPRRGRQPQARHRGSSAARGSGRGMPGALWGVAGCPCRTRGSLWGGAPPAVRGGSSGAGPPHRGAPPAWTSPGAVRARRGPGTRGGPGAASRSRGARCSRSSTGTAGARGPGVMLGTRGAQGSQGCAVLQGARGGTSAAAGAAGAGVGSGAPGGPRAGLRGAAGGRAAAARAPPCCSAAGREGERRAGERRGAGPGGGLGPPGRGEGRTRRGGRGAGAAPGRAGPQGVRASSAPGRGEAGSDGHGRRSLAPLLFPRSLPHTHARREAKPAAATSQLSKLPSATFSSPPLPAPPPRSPSLLPSPAPLRAAASARGRQRAPGPISEGPTSIRSALDSTGPGRGKRGHMDQTSPGAVNS